MISGFITAVVAIGVLGLWGLFRARKKAAVDGPEDLSDLDVLTAVARDAAMPDPEPKSQDASPVSDDYLSDEHDELDGTDKPLALELDDDSGDDGFLDGREDPVAAEDEDPEVAEHGGEDEDGQDEILDLPEYSEQAAEPVLDDEPTVSEIAGADLLSAGIQVTASGPVPVMADYDPEEDQLVVVFDPVDLDGHEPEISVAQGPGEDDMTVLLNGKAVMVVLGAADLSPDAIELIEGDTSVPDDAAVAAAA